MIAWRSDNGGTPTMLRGLAAQHGHNVYRSDGSGLHLVTWAPSAHAKPADDAEWQQLDDGWEVCLFGTWAPESLLRANRKVPTETVADATGRSWPMPTPLRRYPAHGHLLHVPLGANWKPQFHAWQEELVGAAEWAREQILNGITTGLVDDVQVDEPGIVVEDEQRAAMCACTGLVSVLHFTPDVLLALHLIDTYLIGEALKVMSGVDELTIIELAAKLPIDIGA